MGRIIALSSGKGGVGKTVTTVNVAAALSHFNKKVVAIDANLTTSNLGLHLGIPLYPVTLQDVIKGKARVEDSTYFHPAGFRIIPADVSLSKLMLPKTSELLNVFYDVAEDVDFVLIDSAAGLGKETVASIEAADEMITVTNPELSALTDALKLGKMAERYDTKNLGVVLNRVRNERHEFSKESVEDFLELPVLGHVHEDQNVRSAIANKQPVVTYRPYSKSSNQFKSIAARLLGEEYSPNVSLFQRMFSWLR
ncbi:MAG: septum site-determining protein MinD [Candidatus Aenigmatarchaeota archaeon]|nr:MAG: septum site-determining protein MinD [Candidatus Aenigmarchaeota archaeon]